MVIRETTGRKVFLVFNYLFLGLVAFLCIAPMINVLAISLSSKSAAAGGLVKFWPVDFTVDSYKYALGKNEFITAFFVSIKRVILGYFINIILAVLTAFPLSRRSTVFKWRNAYSVFFVFSIIFSGGIIPTYMLIKYLGLLDTIWALVLPSAVSVLNVILLMNFFRELPNEIEEAAFIDGADYWKVLYSIYIPLSKPALATVSLFILIGHWNSWFDGILYMNKMENYPLQSYLQTVIVTTVNLTMSLEEMEKIQKVSDRTFKAAQVFLTALPILMVYPFLQKYFMKGLVLGSVKG
ncbi:MAG TPA: carbohydrate ABC transporter permease [Clostridiaceae bacterium]|nr:carbohydrate ABC transporter permease [Clostridiaceae bacterium]